MCRSPMRNSGQPPLALGLLLALLAHCGDGRQAPSSGPAPAAVPAAPAAAAAAPAARDPEPPDAQRRAVASLAWGRILDLAPEPPRAIDGLSGVADEATRTIAGLGTDGAAQARSIQGDAKDLESAMVDLHAKTVGQEIHIELSADVLFDFDRAEIRPDAAGALAKAAVIIRAHPGRVRVEGHTDSKGKHAYNLGLSERRAHAVVRWLEEREGLRGVAFTARGFAETRPVAPNVAADGTDNPVGRQQNRRVEIVVSTGASRR
jgi:outer membrane protein OmpA-like peptidoglycan-associated protein